MRSKLLILASLFLSSAFQGFSQTPFPNVEHVDINKVKASVALHGDLWTDPATAYGSCEFPKGSGKHVSHLGALWMAGYDAGSKLHVAAQTYRQDGNDYWPGPLDAFDTLTYAVSQTWARIWKVSYIDIATFKAITTHTTSNTPAVILEWPAKNNPYAKGAGSASLTITTDMAPFVDVNNDGDYNPLVGDYPDMKGDQMLWWIFSDNGPTHNNHAGGPDSKPLKVVVKAIAYAYNRSSALDNIVYYEYNVTNESANNYTNFRMAVNADMEIGFGMDDYIGFDSTRRMAIGYNADAIDGTGLTATTYGAAPPIAGVSMLEIPGDNSTTKVPVSSFMYFNNDATIWGNPTCDTQYNHYMRAEFRNGAHLKNDFAGISVVAMGTGPGANTNYVFPGNPANASQWSECISNNPPTDRRGVLSTGDITFTSGSTVKLAFALVVTDTNVLNGCPNVGFGPIWNLADTAAKYYKTILPPKLSVATVQKNAMHIYPNPAKDVMYIDGIMAENGDLKVYDVAGRVMQVDVHNAVNKISIYVNQLAPGLYHIVYHEGGTIKSAHFVKE
jgi:hypothetical protein